jgi:hypothetical protein
MPECVGVDVELGPLLEPVIIDLIPEFSYGPPCSLISR